uniref:Multiple inositol polyphosphate phosphatase 1 n=1 Tax=Cacopsylla melanoneura TaxID=428564 RepID=A0A8D8Y336_9HEMI
MLQHSLLLLLQLSLLVLLPVVLTQSTPEEYTCYAEDEYPYLFFSSKTAYQYIYDKKPQVIPHCKPVQIWMLARHGTRYPRKKEIQKMKDLLTLRAQVLKNFERRDVEKRFCEKDLTNLNKWNYNLTDDLDNQLTFQGHDDLLFLAKRMRSKFPILNDAAGFSPEQIQNHFQLRYTNTPRTKDSAEAFVEGLFGGRQVNMPPPIENDPLIKSYGNCSTWEHEVDSETNKREVTLFEEGPLMKGVISSISQRLGFNYNLSLDKIDLMYEMCRYEKAWHLQTLPAWCAAFSKRELKVLEYYNDLNYYYKAGYGNTLNQKLACPLVKDMFDKFSKTATLRDPTLTDIGALGSFYFSHTTMILLLLTRLDIAHDKVPLDHDNFATQNKRLWRTSLIDPFAANLAAVFYKCTQGEENQIAFYLNEHIVDYPGCNVGLCPWPFIESKFKSVVKSETCNLDFCFNGSTGLSPTLGSLILGLMILLIPRLKG